MVSKKCGSKSSENESIVDVVVLVLENVYIDACQFMQVKKMNKIKLTELKPIFSCLKSKVNTRINTNDEVETS